MNIIKSEPIQQLGYNFIDQKYIPEGLDEYYLRNLQHKDNSHFRPLTPHETEVLITYKNSSDNWSKVLVSEKFDPTLIRNCKFFGLVRIGNIEAQYREFHDFRMPVGLYNSTIISSDFGDNVCIDNVQYLSHYILENDVMIANVNEMATTNHSKFGNGVIKEGEEEKNRVKIEVCNENGGRAILPFDSMLPGDAFLWAEYRSDKKLQEKFVEFTNQSFDSKRGYYGKVGTRTIIKNCRIIKDTWIGSDAYLKGANKIKNVTINSDANRKSQIGEGCELVNGIIGFGCRVFYGVKAVRFYLSSHSQLKYGARLINSFLGNNSTISCCEVLNSLLFPFHEQHHNNSFLCAALVMGQSNLAAGATIGSNHNSRAADGEIQAERGFWPGLCVSLKHNSRFASFTILAKGDYPSELDIKLPFCLVSNHVADDTLNIIPAYWFMYNMYALERNAWKVKDRDKRINKTQIIEFDYLAPDSVNEMLDGIALLQSLKIDEKGCAEVQGWENSKRTVKIEKVLKAILAYQEMVTVYAGMEMFKHFIDNNFASFHEFKATLFAQPTPGKWKNVGGQLIRVDAINQIRKDVGNGVIDSWENLHDRYRTEGAAYANDRLQHAYNAYLTLKNITGQQFTEAVFIDLLTETLRLKNDFAKRVYQSRAKDYQNDFRQMLYNSYEEMELVVGKLDDNTFIQMKMKEADELKTNIDALIEKIQQPNQQPCGA